MRRWCLQLGLDTNGLASGVNVGGGVNIPNPVRVPETFYVSPGVYNWSADPQGI